MFHAAEALSGKGRLRAPATLAHPCPKGPKKANMGQGCLFKKLATMIACGSSGSVCP